MAKRIVLIVLAFALAAAVMFTGCTPARKPMNTNDQYNRTGTNGTTYDQNDSAIGNNWGTRDLSNNNGLSYNNTDNNLGYNNNNDALGNNVRLNTTTQSTDDLERAVEQVQGVKDATVVISGNTAYVGLDLDNNTNTVNNTNIKNNVTQQIRASNTNINTVYVSTETGFMDRLRDVGTGIRGGRPISGFTTELRDMVRRINPVNW
jgi:YhcN/YlaJ family sporulation lipoprotein